MDFFNVHISSKSVKYVNQAMETGWVSEGEKVKEFEAELIKRLGLVNPVALNSGTSALHLALVLAGVNADDEVILPAQTFVATGLVILMQKAIPVFADIDPLTGNILPKSIAEKITPRTKAVIPVHWGGYPCDMDEINALANEHGLIVIEDAAHALGAIYRGKPIGSISEFTAFSFQAIKHLTTADGGALCCQSEGQARRAFMQRWFGIDRANSQPSILGERIYDITEVGYKYHMNDFSAALGLGNLDDLSERLQRRREIAAYYRQKMTSVPGIQLLKSESDRTSSHWLFTMLVERREDFIRRLAEHGIPASVVHLRIDHNSVFGGLRNDLPGQERFNSEQVAIPVHEGLSENDVLNITEVIRQGW
ncbi:MAG: DegT/DnrJ/EryC1/StrS family aminotransferase [Chloroflexota bacterium]